ncbi:MAG TPA: hypothetical protein VEH49_08230, partial [Methylomirabilota bacterium]|nr:hypothetical protein [Methylomirabilota bacterium]
DGHSAGKPEPGWAGLVGFVNQLNESWVAAAQRMSSRVLCDLTEHVGKQADAYFMSLDPLVVGGPVSWAGDEPQPQWLDVAREYTERWHHQQQIRDATHRPGLYETRVFAPVLDTFVRALPHAFRDIDASQGTTVEITLTGEGGGHWVLRRTAGKWELLSGSNAAADAHVSIRGEDAWKIFTRGLRGEAARRRATIRGDQFLGARVVETVAVIA